MKFLDKKKSHAHARSDGATGVNEMESLINNTDWSLSTLGDRQGWPNALKVTLNIILGSKFPMFLFWGPELICFYNDAYRPSLGDNGKHPYALGKPGADVWPEIWHIIKPLIDQVMDSGEATWQEDQLIPIYRNGHIEQVYWTFSYSPAKDDGGQIAGVFVTCTETTEKVKFLMETEESKNQLEFAIEAAGLATWDFDPQTNKFIGNNRLKDWFGLPPNEDFDLSIAINAIAPFDRQRVINSINYALDYDSGGVYDLQYTIIHPETLQERIVRAKGKARFTTQNIAYRFNGTLQDVTAEAVRRIELEASEQRYRTLAHNIPDLITRHDKNYKYIYASPLMEKYTNIPAEEAVGKNYRELGIPEEACLFLDHKLAQIFQDKQQHTIEYPTIDHKGHVLSRMVPEFDDKGEVESVLILTTDITERAKADEENKKLLAMLDASSDFISLASPDGDILYLNPAGKQLMGWNCLQKKTILDSIYEKDRHMAEQILLPKLIKDGHFSHEIRFYNEETGQISWMMWKGIAIRDPHSGQIIALASISPNITQRKAAELSLKESEQRFQAAVKAIQGILWTNDAKGRMSGSQPGWEALTGQTQAQYQGYGWADALHPEDALATIAAWNNAVETQSTFVYEHRLRLKNGNWGIFAVCAIPLINPDGSVREWVGVHTDITLRKEAEIELAQKNELLERINNDLDNFVYTASHDLRAPMSNIEGLMVALRDNLTLAMTQLPIDTSFLLELIEKSVERFKDTIQNLTEITKAQKEHEDDINEIDLNEVVADIKLSIYNQIEEADAIITTDFTTTSTLRFSKKSLNSIFYNLISNAIKYRHADRKPEVQIKTAYLEDGTVLVTVSDNGMGIKAEDQPKMFGRFKRFHDHVEGTGIGLYIVKRIIDSAGGKIEIQSEEGSGTVFRIYFKA